MRTIGKAIGQFVGDMLNTVTSGFALGMGFSLGMLFVLWWMGRLH